MSIGPCIPDLIASGKIPASKAKEAQAVYDELRLRYSNMFGWAGAEQLATEATLRRLTEAAQLKKRQTYLQLKAQADAKAALATFDGGARGPMDPAAAIALFDRDDRAPYSNVELRRKAIRRRALGMMASALFTFGRNVAGQVRNRALLADVTRELFGADTGNANAKDLARAWTQAAEMLRQRFNAAGGDIAKLELWGLPQSHNARKVRLAGGLDATPDQAFAAWRDFTLPLLDRDRMIDRDTGLPFADAQIHTVLRDVFDTIRSDGWAGRKAGAAGGTMLANTRQEHRFLHFRDAESWTAYAERFGQGSAWDAMMAHVSGMARDTAAIEVLGPNPEATIRWIKESLIQHHQTGPEASPRLAQRAEGAAKKIDRLWAEYSGAAHDPESRALALGFSAFRSVETAAKLGSATLTAAPTDLGFQTTTRLMNGLPVARMLDEYLKLLNPASRADRELATALLGIAETHASTHAGVARMLNEEMTGEVSRRLAEGTLRLSGLNAWTDAGDWAFGMTVLRHLTDERAKPFAKLNAGFRGMLARYGIDQAGWDAIRATRPRRQRGADWIVPSDIADQALGDRLLEAIAGETDLAVPKADLTTRALVNSIAPRGTLAGEIVRTAALFKTFGISLLLTQGRRVLQAGDWSTAGKRAAMLMIPATIGGAIAVQLKEIAKGRDPRPMEDEKFWGAAMFQGGALGIFGDFLYSSQNRFGGGLAGTLGGPGVQTVQKLASIPTAKSPSWATYDLLRTEAPGSSLWYARLAMDRLLSDQVRQQLDPNYDQAWRRMERAAEMQGQAFWWAPGETAPGRAPDFANIFNEAPEPQGGVQ